MLDRIRSLFRLKGTLPASGGGKVKSAPGAKAGASGMLAPPTPPKVKNGQMTVPSYMTTNAAQTSARPKNDLNLANVDIVNTYRFGADTDTTIRSLARGNPDFAAAISGHLRLGIPEKYVAIAYDLQGNFNLEGTQFCLQFLDRLNTMPGYDVGFNPTNAMQSLGESLAKEMLLVGGVGMELVLNKARQPAFFAPISVGGQRFRFYDDWSGGTKTLRPVQVVGGEEIDLDVPNFFMTWLDPSVIDPYPQPPLESAIQPVLAGSTFLNDLRRLCERHVYPRIHCTVDGEKLKGLMSEEQLLDSDKRVAFLNETFATIQDTVNNLGVEEALVHFDFLDVQYVEGQDGDVPNTFDTVKGIYDAKIATGARSMPSLLGHGSGSQNIASTETLLGMLTANGLVRLKLQEMFSKGLTLGANLMGLPVVVKFEYDDIDLRPATELEAFKAQRQSRWLELVSLGYMTDEEFCLRTLYRLPPTGFTPRWNTEFMQQAGLGRQADAMGNNYSGTGVGGGQSGGGAANQSRTPQTPTGKRGGNGK
jgi:hypothetical protein